MSAIAAAVVFVWLGMVAAISFLEAPLKFQAPGITVQLGLGIGRLVFRALNAVEIVLATVVVAVMTGLMLRGLAAQPPGSSPLTAIGVAVHWRPRPWRCGPGCAVAPTRCWPPRPSPRAA